MIIPYNILKYCRRHNCFSLFGGFFSLEPEWTTITLIIVACGVFCSGLDVIRLSVTCVCFHFMHQTLKIIVEACMQEEATWSTSSGPFDCCSRVVKLNKKKGAISDFSPLESAAEHCMSAKSPTSSHHHHEAPCLAWCTQRNKHTEDTSIWRSARC